MKLPVIGGGVALAFALSAVGIVSATGGTPSALRPAGRYHGAAPAGGDQPETTAPSGNMSVASVSKRLKILQRPRTRHDAIDEQIASSPLLEDRAVNVSTSRL